MPSIQNARISPKPRDHCSSYLYPPGGRRHVPLAKSDTSPFNSYCQVLILVSVDPDHHLNCKRSETLLRRS